MKKKTLIGQSKEFAINFKSIRPLPDPTTRILTIEELAVEILKNSKGAVIGELHDSISSKTFLVSQMKTLVDQGVEVLFMEGLYEAHQADLDYYFLKSTHPDDLPLSIEYAFTIYHESSNPKNAESGKKILRAAKEAGVRVVAIDSRLSTLGNARVATMNLFAKGVIEREMPIGKYLIWCGGAHATTTRDWLDGSEVNVPGFSQIFNIPSVIAIDKPYSFIKTYAEVKFEGDIKQQTCDYTFYF